MLFYAAIIVNLLLFLIGSVAISRSSRAREQEMKRRLDEVAKAYAVRVRPTQDATSKSGHGYAGREAKQQRPEPQV